MPLHVGKGRNISTAISDIIDYVENPQKTDFGKFIYGYECDTRLADAEFLLSKRQYANLTGRNQGADDVIAYHLRQAFKPGEVTPEEANQIGRDLALKLTKGNHAFVVCTHVDKHHVHNHIIINSTTLDCQKKFRNFWGSTWAIRRMNDKLCLEHGLSIVENPKPSREHYGTWLGNKKQPSFQEQIRIAIDAALEEKPKDFEELLQKLETAGLEVNRERKHLRFRVPGQENYTRCDTLKGDYTEQAIKKRIAGTRTVKPRHAFSKKTVSKVGLLVDIEAAIRSGKGPGYERWAKVFNLKQLSQAVLYLKEHGDMGYEDLLEKANATTTNFNTLSVQIKDLESKMNANAELQKQIVNYAKTRAVYVEYRKAGYSKKFRTEHEAEILLHQAAKNHFDELGIKKLPSVKALREEYADLLEKANATTTNFNTLSVQIKDLESRMNANAELQKQIVNYAKTRAVYVEYRKAGYSKKFRTAHEAEILLHQAAKNHFDELGIKKLPSVKSLREEYTDLLEQKRKAYSAYKQAKNDMKELHNVRANVEYLLEISSPPQPQRSTEKSRQ